MTDYVVLPPVEAVPAEVRQVTNGQTVAPGSMGAPRMALSDILSRAAAGRYAVSSVTHEISGDSSISSIQISGEGRRVDIALSPADGGKAQKALEGVRQTIEGQQQSITDVAERNGYLMAVYLGDIKAGVDIRIHFGQTRDVLTCIDMGLGELTPEGHLLLKLEGAAAEQALEPRTCWNVTVPAFGY